MKSYIKFNFVNSQNNHSNGLETNNTLSRTPNIYCIGFNLYDNLEVIWIAQTPIFYCTQTSSNKTQNNTNRKISKRISTKTVHKYQVHQRAGRYKLAAQAQRWCVWQRLIWRQNTPLICARDIDRDRLGLLRMIDRWMENERPFINKYVYIVINNCIEVSSNC